MAFSAADVKNLREMTGVGMMDCKRPSPLLTAILIRLWNGSVRRASPPLRRRPAASPPRAWLTPPSLMASA